MTCLVDVLVQVPLMGICVLAGIGLGGGLRVTWESLRRNQQ